VCHLILAHPSPTASSMDTLALRFWSKVREDNSGCWLWTGARYYNGYGVMRVGGRYDGFNTGAHRIAWQLTRGPIKDGLMVCHRCDVKLCVNPDHLFLGTGSENARDSVQKGRHPKTHVTHCPQGHAYNQFNTYIEKKTSGPGRKCKVCMRAHSLLATQRYRQRQTYMARRRSTARDSVRLVRTVTNVSH
jgi:HNH endonuclease